MTLDARLGFRSAKIAGAYATARHCCGNSGRELKLKYSATEFSGEFSEHPVCLSYVGALFLLFLPFIQGSRIVAQFNLPTLSQDFP